ncbi:MAG: gliding motility-associated C-terminal domain-containing protein [Bacteroidales bacterium]|nr:gliding motility-associated C-terminal domain-containing protein [Bacteroidales bacterium]
MKNNNILGMVALLWIMVMSMNHVVGQTYQIPTSGTTNVTGCSGIVQDPGGSGDYSNSCNGYLVITSDQTGCMPHISGSYNTESSFDYLYVYDGTTTSGTQLAYCTGTGTVDVTSTTGSLMLYFHSDGSVVRSGFDLNLTCSGGCGCGGPVVTYSTSSGHILVNWNAATGVTHYFIEYGPHGFTPGNGTRTRVTGTSYNISGLTDGMQYDVYVWFDCGDDNQLTNEVGTMISATPNNIFFVPSSGNNSVTACNGILYDHAGPDGNYNNSCSGYTIIYPDEPTCVVHLEGSYNTESCCDHIYVYDGAGTGGTLLGQFQGTGTINVSSTTGPLTVQFTSDGSVVYSGFSLQFSCRGSCSCGGSPYGVTVVQGNTGVLVSWDAGLDPDVHNFIIEYGLSGFTPGTGTTVMTSDTSYELIGLTTLATYDIYIYYDCGGDNVITDETATIITFCVPDAVACIDFSDWSNPAITCTYGTFDNPYATVGVVDNGYASVESRHTINYINETDPRTNDELQTIPPCELYSVRLGNWNTNYEAESISYDFNVDTNNADILLLKYAAVLENPGHSTEEQPRFDFEILDQNGNQIDPTCGYASFIPGGPGMGDWHTTGSLMWKDWTNVGFDVSAYHGQTIRVRLTTYDCDQGGHFGYAYFTLGCKKRTIVAETCGEMLSNTYTAPAGFAYQWYYEDQPGNIICTDQSCSVTVGSGHQNLHCHVSFIGNPSCGFDLMTSLTARYPLASFAPERDGCTWSFMMNNNSAVSDDGETPNDFFEPCESAHWDFGDGTTSDEYNPSHEFPGPGTYVITLISGLSQDACLDTTTFTVDLMGNYPVITGNPYYDAICKGDGTTLIASGGNTYRWYVGNELISENASVYVEPEQTTTYTLVSVGADNCEVTIEHELTVNPTSDSYLTDSICQGENYTLHGFSLPPQLSAGTFSPQIVLRNQYGCDSTVHLTLTVKPLPNTSLGRPFNHCFEDFGDAALLVPEANCDTYLWSSGATTQGISVSEEGTYSVTASKNGCENHGEITIYNVCPFNIYLPNCITPTNVDGINDVFKLPTTKDIAEFAIHIYDRFGKLVFSSTDPNFSWDGNINGKIMSNATYTYRIDLTTTGAEKRVIKGILTVL